MEMPVAVDHDLGAKAADAENENDVFEDFHVMSPRAGAD
jgi:hypothetical protein